MIIAVYGKSFERTFFSYINDLFHLLKLNNAQIFVFEPFYKYLDAEYSFSPKIKGVFTTFKDIEATIDFVFSIGGDGTFLESLGFVRDKSIPMLGLNTGRLGFLADIAKEDISNAVDAIFKGNYSLEKRTLLELKTKNNFFGEQNFALNDITVHKRDSSSMITIHTYIDDEFLNSYWADGLIISTPTGSTAYSLSAGGPIVVPTTENFVITPIAPHNLTIRPIVVSDMNNIKLKINGRDSNYLVSLDSRCEVCDTTLELNVSKADFKINVVKLQGHGFFATLRNKLLWGLDRRN